MVVKIGSDIRSRFDGYNKLMNVFFEACCTYDDEILIDFEGISFFDANLCSLLGAFIEIFKKNGNQVRIVNLSNYINVIFRKNSFLRDFNEDEIEDTYATAIKYKKFKPGDDSEFKDYVRDELLNKNEFPSHTLLLGQKIIENIFELYENARTHGQCDFIHACGQYFPQHESKPLRFTIVDRGINIKENVNRYLNKEIESHEAIHWAIQKGNTTKSGNIPGGLGLDIIFQFIKLNNGKIQIVSSDGFWEYKNGNIFKAKLSKSFEGTIANLEFNLNDKKHYKMSNEEFNTDLNNLF